MLLPMESSRTSLGSDFILAGTGQRSNRAIGDFWRTKHVHCKYMHIYIYICIYTGALLDDLDRNYEKYTAAKFRWLDWPIGDTMIDKEARLLVMTDKSQSVTLLSLLLTHHCRNLYSGNLNICLWLQKKHWTYRESSVMYSSIAFILLLCFNAV